jgi:membrane protease YdiL (CAAX protease family)
VFLGGLFALAAFLALLLQWTRSLFVPIVAHATFNVITLVLATFASDPRI